MTRLILLLFLISIAHVFCKRPIVKIQNGKIRGDIMFTPSNRTVYAFRGIPYAKPPLDELRFQPPQKPDNWDGILNNSAKNRKCIQISSELHPDESEDCLYLHVYTPKLPTKEQIVSLPVMYVIHGGAFVFGTPTPDMLGPQYLMDYDIVVVSVGYRLGFLGFLSTEDLNCPGNNGFKDQQFGLKWVQENIQAFGGDPKRVTIFGESAGAASVAYQLLGNNAKGLFVGAIQNSGTSIATWALQKNPKRIAYTFAKNINSTIDESNTSTSELLEFFRTLDVQRIKTASVEVFGEGLLACHYNTIVGFLFAGAIEPDHDGAFLTRPPYQKFLDGDFYKVPTMMGVTSEESLFLGNDPALEERMIRYHEEPENFVLPNMHINDLETKRKAGRLIRQMYDASEYSPLNRAKAIKYFSETSFDRPIIKQADLQSKYTKVFFYVFGYSGAMGKMSLFSDVEGAGNVVHAEEMMYLFNSIESKDIYSFPDQDRLTMKRMLTLWTNFVKHQNPTPERTDLLEGIIWPKVLAADRMPYLLINDTLKVKYNYKRNMMKIYQELYDKYAVYPLVTY